MRHELITFKLIGMDDGSMDGLGREMLNANYPLIVWTMRGMTAFGGMGWMDNFVILDLRVSLPNRRVESSRAEPVPSFTLKFMCLLYSWLQDDKVGD